MLKAGDRLKGLRLILGLTREQMADGIPIKRSRYYNLEQLKARVADVDFEMLGEKYPEFVHWLVMGGKIKISELKKSSDPLVRSAAIKLEAGVVISEEFNDVINAAIEH